MNIDADTDSRVARWAILLYALTGFTGLLIEQCFEKYLIVLVGATVSASSVVIFAYFLGFALGGLATAALQKRARIARPLAWYGAIELTVGIAAVLFVYAFHPSLVWLAPLQGGLHRPVAKAAVRFLFGCLFVLPTAALMGASFPLMAQAVDRGRISGGSLWARAYASNLAGAIAACLLGPYLIYPAIGLRGALWLSFGVCAAVFAGAALLQRSEGSFMPQAARPVGGGEPVGRRGIDKAAGLLLAAAFASGLIVFALEIVWTHLIGAVLGGSVYAFSAMLLMVLLGLFLGARRTAASLGSRRPADYVELFFRCAVLTVVQLVAWGLASLLFAFTPPRPLRNFASAEMWRLVVAAMLILPSSTALGALFPSLLGSPALEGGERCFLVGYMNAANAFGCMAGTLLGLFVMIPLLGSELSLKVVAVALVAFSFVFIRRGEGKKTWTLGFAAVLLVGVPCVFWHWDRFLLDSYCGVTFGMTRSVEKGGRQAATGAQPASGPAASRPRRMIYFQETAQGGFTTVVEQEHEGSHRLVRTLFTNGKFEGDDDREGQWDAQFGIGSLSAVYVTRMDRALLIGLGTGHSALVLKQLGYKDIDVAEFSPSIVEAAQTCFTRLNRKVLSDPNVHLMEEDGRNVLIASGARYDLITIEITSIWYAGATNVYSQEFYEEARKRLRWDGVLQQWVQLHYIGPREIASAIATARAVFPYVSYWRFGGQGFLIATAKPQDVTEARRAYLLKALSGPGLDRAESSDHLLGRMLASRIMSPQATDRMIAQLHPPINTDQNRFLEYATPRYYSSDFDWAENNFAFFSSFGRQGAPSAPAAAAAR